MRMKNNWPTTVEELVDECKSLEDMYDLYTLGKRDEPFSGEAEPRVDGTDYLAGEYKYGVAMVPAQWVTSILGDMEDAGTCRRIYHPNRITKTCTCSNCGYGASDERWAYCPKCGHKYVHGEVEEMWKSVGRKVAE